MKKTLALAAIPMALALSLAGANITVTAPAAGDAWGLGTTHTITWTSAGVSGPLSIKLRLADQPTSNPLLEIVASTANDGSHSWTIPATIPQGTYEVRVRTASDDPFIFGDSGNFQIGPAPAPPAAPSLTLLEPNQGTGQALSLGASQPIRWKAVNVTGNVRLELVYHQGQMLGIIAEDLPAANGVFNWKAGQYGDGKYAPTGEKYKYHVRVRSQGAPSTYGQSEPPFGLAFKVVLPPNPGRLVRPDLIVCTESSIVTPLNVPGTLHVYVKNIGLGKAKAPFKVLFSIVGHCNKTVTVDSDLSPGESRLVGECSAQGPGQSSFKTYAQADPDGQVSETHEDNNRVEGWFACRKQKQGSAGPVTCSNGTTIP